MLLQLCITNVIFSDNDTSINHFMQTFTLPAILLSLTYNTVPSSPSVQHFITTEQTP